MTPHIKTTDSTWKPFVLLSLFLIIVTAAVYWQVQGFDFVNYDDDDYVYDNPHIQDGITFKSIIWAFTSRYASNWFPLTWLSHMADVSLFGLDPGSHHLTSLMFHIANILLMFLVFRKMTGNLWQSAFIAALFAIHPLHIQSVAWVSERKDVLSAFFWMLTLLAYVRYVRRPGWATYVWVLVFFILGLMSKPMAVTLPFVLLLLDFWPLGRLRLVRSEGVQPNIKIAGLIREKIPLFLLSAASAGITFYVQQKGGAVQSFDIVPLADRVPNVVISYVHYILKTMYPVHLATFYPYPVAFPWWKVTAAIVVLAALTMLAIRHMHRHPYVIVGWFWFIGTLVPVIGLVQVGVQSMADRYMYLPIVGLFIIIAWGLPELISNWRYKRFWLGAPAIMAVVVLSVVTWNQTGYWKNSESLFSHAIAVTENNFVAHYNLGIALASKDETDQAIAHYQKSLAISPNQPDVYMSLGLAFDEQGENEKALVCLQQSVLLDPEYYHGQYNLGTLLLKKGEWDQAIPHLEKAAQLHPDNDQAHFNLAKALFHKMDYVSALKYALKVISMNPGHEKAHQIAGVILFKQGNLKEAQSHFSSALSLNPYSAEALQYEGYIFLKHNQLDKALSSFKKALIHDPDNKEARQLVQQLEAKLAVAKQTILRELEKNPDNPPLRKQLGKIFQAQGLTDSAIEQYQLVISQHPECIDALFELAALYADKGQYATAISYMEQAISFQPDNPAHDYNIACLYALQEKAPEALLWLKKALDKGYKNWDQIRTDDDLKSIRNTKEFKKLMKNR